MDPRCSFLDGFPGLFFTLQKAGPGRHCPAGCSQLRPKSGTAEEAGEAANIIFWVMLILSIWALLALLS
jgi:hypothetical protein